MLVTERNQDNLDDFITDSDRFISDFSNPEFSFDVNPAFTADDDLLGQLAEDLEIPMLLDQLESDHFLSLDDNLGDLDNIDTGQLSPDAFPNMAAVISDEDLDLSMHIKAEPVSPPSSVLPPSPSGSDESTASETWAATVTQMLETPPITPPEQEGSPPHSPNPGHITDQKTVVSSPIKIIPMDLNGMNVSNKGMQVVSGTKFVIRQPTAAVNNRLKIQPKPSMDTVPSVTTTMTLSPASSGVNAKVAIPKSNTGQGKKIQITADRLSKLTQAGVLKMQQGGTTPAAGITIKTEPVSYPPINNCVGVTVSSPKTLAITTPRTVTMTAAGSVCSSSVTPAMASVAWSNNPSVKQETDLKALRRQQRMIKNRESACLSRKKKKEYVLSLEIKLNELAKSNSLLTQENEALKQHLREVQEECNLLKSGMFSNKTKKVTALFAVIFMISLNLGPLSGIFLSNRHNLNTIQNSLGIPEESSVHQSRSLLWTGNESQSIPQQRIKYTRPGSYMNTTLNHPMCPMYINQTESIRLDSELRGWFRLETPKPNVTKSEPVTHPLGHVLSPPISPRFYHHLLAEPQIQHAQKQREASSTREIQVYETVPLRFVYSPLFEAIQRREDTFYVVSFSGDHLLLPATVHNQTLRPRMSLVLPAMPLNDSMQPPPNHIAMMQIDCEVMNTKLLHVKEAVIPSHLRSPKSSKTSNGSYYDAAASYPQDRQNYTRRKPNEKTSGSQNGTQYPVVDDSHQENSVIGHYYQKFDIFVSNGQKYSLKKKFPKRKGRISS